MELPAERIAPQKVRTTADEYLALPESNLPMHLIDGEIIDMATPNLDHQLLVGKLYKLLSIKAEGLGGFAVPSPMDIRLDEFNVVQPDVFIILPDSKCQIIDKKLYGAPDLVVEVLSPSTAKLDRKQKFQLYEQFGVREYWMVDPVAAVIEVWGHDGARFSLHEVYEKGEKIQSPLLGEIAVDEIFG